MTLSGTKAVRAYLRQTRLRRLMVRWRHRQVVESDVVLASYPKSGNTWLRFMLGHALSGCEPDFESIEEVVPYVGEATSRTPRLRSGGRLLKTHEECQQRYHRAILIVRDGRDVAVSYYYHRVKFGEFEGSFSEFLSLFLDGNLDGRPGWSEHVISWLHGPVARSGDLLLVRYEDLLGDTLQQLQRALSFLDLPDDEQAAERIVEASAFDRMQRKDRQSDNSSREPERWIPRVRVGRAGQWRDIFSGAENERFRADMGTALRLLGYID